MIYAFLAMILGLASVFLPLPLEVRIAFAVTCPVLFVLYVRAMNRRADRKAGR